MSEGQCESQQPSVVPDSLEHGSSSDRENNPNSLTPSSDVDLSPSIEELIERIKILALETPRSLHSKLPRAPFPTPAKASPDSRTIVDNSSSSSFTEDGQESTIGLKRLKKAIERRLGGKRFASPGRSSRGSKHAADAVDNKLLAVMLATEHQRRQRMEWDLEVERSSDQAILDDQLPPFDHHQFDSTGSAFSPRTRSVVSDASVHVTKGSSCSEIDTSSELEKFQHEGDVALSLEYSLREVSEVFSVFVKCNKWMLRSRVDASPVEKALDKRDLVGADIFRQAIDISFGEVVTREQKQWIYDSYMRTIDTSQGQLEEVACDDSPILLEGSASKEDDDKQRDEEEGMESATNEEEKMAEKDEVMRCACFRARLSLLKFDKREESKEEEEEERVDETRGREGEKEDLDEIFGGGERRLAKKEEIKSRGRRKWRSLSEYENESSSTPINEESGKRRTFSESDVLNASLFISDDFLSEDYIRKLERSVSLVNEISSNVSEDLAKSDTSAKFPKEEEEEEEVEEEAEEASFNSDDLAKCSRRKSSRSTSSADSVGRRSDISEKTRKFQLNLREMEAEDEQESLPDSTKCTMDSNSVHSDNLSLDLDDVYDTFQRSERILASCLADTENRRDRRNEIGEFGSLSDSVYFTPPADDQASSEDKPPAELPHVSTDSSSVSKETSRVKECEDDDVFEDVGTMKPCERRNSFHSFLNRILFKQTRYGTMKGSPNEDENKNTLKQNIVDGERISKTRCGGRRTVAERCRPGNCLSG